MIFQIMAIDKGSDLTFLQSCDRGSLHSRDGNLIGQRKLLSECVTKFFTSVTDRSSSVLLSVK